MKYALGNMLNGAGGLNADGLSLDLQFAADKTLTARKGPTPVFTRASTATFVGSNGLIQSAAINTPRFDHDPLTQACKGLLIEEQRINQILQSENFGTTWALTNATASLNVATAPDGSTNADKIINTSGGVQGRAQQNFTLSGSNVYSIFAKADEWGWVYIAPLQATGGVWFDLTNGTIGTQQVGFVGSITSFGNGWYRCAVQCTGLSTPLTARIHPTNADAVLTLGDGTSGILVWGAQLEAGAFPTSYIPTTTGPVTRSADTCSITGSAFSGLYNPLEGTILAGYLFRTNSAGRPFYIGDGTSSTNTMEAFNGGSGVTSNVFSGGAQQYTRDVVATNNSMVKTALAVAVSNAMLAVNGTLATSGGGLMPVGVNQLIIGNRPDGARNINGHISVVRYFRKRLPNAKLQTLTT